MARPRISAARRRCPYGPAHAARGPSRPGGVRGCAARPPGARPPGRQGAGRGRFPAAALPSRPSGRPLAGGPRSRGGAPRGTAASASFALPLARRRGRARPRFPSFMPLPFLLRDSPSNDDTQMHLTPASVTVCLPGYPSPCRTLPRFVEFLTQHTYYYTCMNTMGQVMLAPGASGNTERTLSAHSHSVQPGQALAPI